MNILVVILMMLLTPTTLAKYILAISNLPVLPDASVCKNHISPLETLDILIKPVRTRSTVIANRGGGKTLMGSLLATLLALKYKGLSIMILSGSGQQALYMVKYIHRFTLIPEIAKMVKTVLKTRITFKNGSSISVLLQSHTSVRGAHCEVLIMDEVEEFDYDIFQAALSVPKDGIIPLKIICLSTHHKHDYIVSRLTDAGWDLYKWCIWDVINCQDAQCPCDLQEMCNLICRGHNGFFSPEEVYERYLSVDREVFDAEWLCNRPTPRGILFPDFNPDEVTDPDIYPDPADDLWIGWDFGARMTAAVMFTIKQDTLHVYREWGFKMYAISDCLMEIGKWLYRCSHAGDPAGLSEANEFAQQGIELHRPRLRVRDRILNLARFISHRRIKIHPSCKILLDTLPRIRDRGNYIPVKDGTEHHLDALTYGIAAAVNNQQQGIPNIQWL